MSDKNMEKMELVSIGSVEKNGKVKFVKFDAKYAEALTGLDGFSHCILVWWAHKYVEHRFRMDNIMELPYAPGVKSGLFSTRSPVRPNPVCISVCEITSIDSTLGIIETPEMDLAEGTPILDAKPYYGVADRVKEIRRPDWVPSEWPEWWMAEKEETYE